MKCTKHNRRFILKTLLTCLILLLVIITHAKAQSSLPVNATRNDRIQLFHQSPDSVAIGANTLLSLFQKKTNTRIMLNTEGRLQLDGSLEEVIEKYNGLIRAARFKLINYPGATLFFSQTLLPSGHYQYRCLIAGKEIQDGYFAIGDGDQLWLVKRNINSLRNE